MKYWSLVGLGFFKIKRRNSGLYYPLAQESSKNQVWTNQSDVESFMPFPAKSVCFPWAWEKGHSVNSLNHSSFVPQCRGNYRSNMLRWNLLYTKLCFLTFLPEVSYSKDDVVRGHKQQSVNFSATRRGGTILSAIISHFLTKSRKNNCSSAFKI